MLQRLVCKAVSYRALAISADRLIDCCLTSAYSGRDPVSQYWRQMGTQKNFDCHWKTEGWLGSGNLANAAANSLLLSITADVFFKVHGAWHYSTHVPHNGPRSGFPYYSLTTPTKGSPLSATWGRAGQLCRIHELLWTVTGFPVGR